MERRQLVKMIAMITGCTLVGGELLLSGCGRNQVKVENEFSKDTIELLEEIADTILPRTGSPGARDVGAGRMIAVLVDDCYDNNEQEIFHAGLRELEDASEKMHGAGFMRCSQEQRRRLLVLLDGEAAAYQRARKQTDPPHYFTMIKQLTLFAFFTSQKGSCEALRHVAVPGTYDGAFPYHTGDKSWAE